MDRAELTRAQKRRIERTHGHALHYVHKLWLWEQQRRVMAEYERHEDHPNPYHPSHDQGSRHPRHDLMAPHELWTAYAPILDNYG